MLARGFKILLLTPLLASGMIWSMSKKEPLVLVQVKIPASIAKELRVIAASYDMTRAEYVASILKERASARR